MVDESAGFPKVIMSRVVLVQQDSILCLIAVLPEITIPGSTKIHLSLVCQPVLDPWYIIWALVRTRSFGTLRARIGEILVLISIGPYKAPPNSDLAVNSGATHWQRHAPAST